MAEVFPQAAIDSEPSKHIDDAVGNRFTDFPQSTVDFKRHETEGGTFGKTSEDPLHTAINSEFAEVQDEAEKETWKEENLLIVSEQSEEGNDEIVGFKKNAPKTTIISEAPKKPNGLSKPFQCELCPKAFPNVGKLNQHKKYHIGKKPFKCEVCAQRFYHFSDLRNHGRIHTGERPFKCDFCEKTFVFKANLNLHMRSHSGERPFECGVCFKSFALRNTLKVHQRTHTGERPYKCNICQKTYSYTASLEVHKRTHTGERPFQCDVCPKNYTRKGKLTEHLRTHAKETETKKLIERIIARESEREGNKGTVVES